MTFPTPVIPSINPGPLCSPEGIGLRAGGPEIGARGFSPLLRRGAPLYLIDAVLPPLPQGGGAMRITRPSRVTNMLSGFRSR